VKLNGVTVTPACGCNSVPVNTCAPSANRADVEIHTFAHPSELNVPIALPSIEIEYFDNPPSPDNKNVGVADADAVESHPICKFWPHVPLSNTTEFTVPATDEPAKTSRTATIDAAMAERRRTSLLRRGRVRLRRGI
jgi:hypothetical protein